MDWSDLPYFLAVIRHGSMGAAAKALGVATTTVGRRVAALEDAVGFRLLERTPDGPRVTEEGRHFAELARGVETRMNDLERALQSWDAHPRGAHVRITATEGVCAEIIAPSLGELGARRPDLHVTINSQQTVVSLARREADLAIRMTRPTLGQSLIIRRLGTIELGLFATSTYLEGRTNVSTELSDLHWLGYDDSYGPIPEVTWFEERDLSENLRVRTNSTRVLLNATLQSLGVGLLPVFLGKRTPNLLRVSVEATLPARTLWLTYHEDFRDYEPVAEVADHLVSAFEAYLD